MQKSSLYALNGHGLGGQVRGHGLGGQVRGHGLGGQVGRSRIEVNLNHKNRPIAEVPDAGADDRKNHRGHSFS